MGKAKKYLLSTRPLPKEVLLEAEEQGIIIDELSFIDTKPIASIKTIARIKELAAQKIIIVFTSMNAVDAVATHAKNVNWIIYCIGNTTRKLVEKHWGLESIAATAENARLLAERIIDDGVKDIVFFCGNVRRDELPNKFRSEKMGVEEIIVYETEETPLPIIKEYDAILFYSPSAVQSFFSVNKPGTKTVLFAIGKTTAEAIRQYRNQKVFISSTPDKIELARQAIAHLNAQ